MNTKQPAMIPRSDLSVTDALDALQSRLCQANDVVTVMVDDDFDTLATPVKVGVAWSVQQSIEDSRELVEHLWKKVRPLVNASENDFAGHELTLPEHMERVDYITAAIKEFIAAADRFPQVDDVDELVGKVLPKMVKARQFGEPHQPAQ